MLDFSDQVEVEEDDFGGGGEELSDEGEPKENILKALLHHKEDSLCLKYMGYYTLFLNKDLFLFSLQKNNLKFI